MLPDPDPSPVTAEPEPSPIPPPPEVPAAIPAVAEAADAVPLDAPSPDTPTAGVSAEDLHQGKRIVEAMIFAAGGPVDEGKLAGQLPAGVALPEVLAALAADYAFRGVALVRLAGGWAFRTADDLAWLLERQISEERRLSRAALEMLAIIAYHQPVTRAEVEDVRGVATSKGTLDVLLETGWVRPRGRRRAPGRPVTYGTTAAFLTHFGLDTIRDLPGLAELKGAGLLDGNLPPGFTVPEPRDAGDLTADELPLDDDDDGRDEATADLLAALDAPPSPAAADPDPAR